MMTPEKFAQTGKSNVESFEQVAGAMLAGAEQLAHLNLAASRAAIADSFEHVQSLLEVRDPQQFIALQAGTVQPMVEKSVSYGRQVYDIVSSTGAEVARSLEGKIAEAQQAFVAAMDSAVRNAPAGSETAVALFKSALTASQDAIQSAQNAAKQAVQSAESNLATMTEQAVGTTKAVAKKR